LLSTIFAERDRTVPSDRRSVGREPVRRFSEIPENEFGLRQAWACGAMDSRRKNERMAKMFQVKHFRHPFVEKDCILDTGGLWKTPLIVNCVKSGGAVTIGDR
jgi:hypothetical protein